MHDMTMREKQNLDEWITGHYGEDQLRPEEEDACLRRLARELAAKAKPGQTAAEIVTAWEYDDAAEPMAEWYNADWSGYLADLVAYRLAHDADMPRTDDGPDPDDDYEPDDEALEIAAAMEAERDLRSDAQALAEDVAFFERYTEA